MELDIERLEEIKDYIKHLDETIGLEPSTVADVFVCIENYKLDIIKRS